MSEYFLDEYEPIQQQMKESIREISLTDEEANELVVLINETSDYLCKSMRHGYYVEVDFLDGLKRFVEYDKHVSKKQMIKFWNLYDEIPSTIQSGLL